MRFAKYHALGNDYLVLNPANFPTWQEPSIAQICVICHRNFGVGSDGILWGPLESQNCDFRLRIFNPDGSEAEKSGNGLRIFSRYLWDQGLIQKPNFTLETSGGAVRSEIHDAARLITIDMGRVSFSSSKIPINGPEREVINEHIHIIRRLDFTDVGRIEATYREHHALCQCLLDGRLDEALALLQSHIERSQEFSQGLTLRRLAEMRTG